MIGKWQEEVKVMPAIMDNDWRESPEYQELLQLMEPFNEDERSGYFQTLKDDIRDAKRGEQERLRAKRLLDELRRDVDDRNRKNWESTYLRMAGLVERLSGIDL